MRVAKFKLTDGSVLMDFRSRACDGHAVWAHAVPSRQSTGAVYWEGAVRLDRDGAQVGRGYLELTGYADAVRLGSP